MEANRSGIRPKIWVVEDRLDQPQSDHLFNQQTPWRYRVNITDKRSSHLRFLNKIILVPKWQRNRHNLEGIVIYRMLLTWNKPDSTRLKLSNQSRYSATTITTKKIFCQKPMNFNGTSFKLVKIVGAPTIKTLQHKEQAMAGPLTYASNNPKWYQFFPFLVSSQQLPSAQGSKLTP